MALMLPKIISGYRKRLFVRLVLIGFLQAFCSFYGVWLIKALFDQMQPASIDVVTQPTEYYLYGLLACALLGAFLRYAERVESERLGQHYVYQTRLLLYKRLSRLNSRSIQGQGKGGLMLRFIGDLSALRLWVSQGVAKFTVGGVMIGGVLIAFLQISPLLSGVLFFTILLGGSASLLLGPFLERAALEVRKRRNYLANNIHEKISSISVVQLFHQNKREQRRIIRQSQRLRDAMLLKSKVIGLLRAISEATSAIAILLVVMIGYDQVSKGHMTVGSVAAAITLLGYMVHSLKDLGRVHEYWKNSRVSMRKIERFFKIRGLVKQKKQAISLPPGKGEIWFKEVSFDSVLKDISLHFPAASVVALVGPNGAGKSTLLSLAARLFDPDQGSVELDGINIADVKLSSLRKSVGLVSPDLPLLSGTIEKNIRYRWQSVSEAEVSRILKLCGIHEMLANFEQGLETRVVNEGKNLSIGQRQRIMLARALLGSPRLLLLDETDANLDAESLQVLDNVIKNFRGTVVMATHRTERLHSVDQVIHLLDGKIVEQGQPQFELNNNGLTEQIV